jgi:hypothetical protein
MGKSFDFISVPGRSPHEGIWHIEQYRWYLRHGPYDPPAHWILRLRLDATIAYFVWLLSMTPNIMLAIELSFHKAPIPYSDRYCKLGPTETLLFPELEPTSVRI